MSASKADQAYKKETLTHILAIILRDEISHLRKNIADFHGHPDYDRLEDRDYNDIADEIAHSLIFQGELIKKLL